GVPAYAHHCKHAAGLRLRRILRCPGSRSTPTHNRVPYSAFIPPPFRSHRPICRCPGARVRADGNTVTLRDDPLRATLSQPGRPRTTDADEESWLSNAPITV